MADTTIRSPARVSDLCVECGLCCSDALFDYAPLPETEVALARSLGMEVIQIEGGSAFRKPCACQTGTLCSVYLQQRPRRCATFFCKLATRVDMGEVELDQARNIVAGTHRMLRKIENYKENGETYRQAISRWHRTKPGHAKPIDLIMVALVTLLKEFYFKSDDVAGKKG